jgi:branched-chain amino acid transport system permease protein
MAQREESTRPLGPLRERPFAAATVGIVVLVFLALAQQLASGNVAVADLATFTKEGLLLGVSLGLAGIGLAMTYSILNFANFAHGDLMTAGAFAGWVTAFVVAGFGEFTIESLLLIGGPLTIDTNTLGISIANTPLAIVLGLVVAAVASAGLALLIDRVVFEPMRDQAGISLLIASVGVALVIRYLLVFFFQASNRGLTAGQETPSWTIPVGSGSVVVSAHELTLAAVAVLLMVGTHVLLQYTKLGTAMRAMADNEDLARVTGIPTERVVRMTWLLGGGLTGAAGFLVALRQGTLTTDLGWGLLLLIFAAVILGGIGSVYGAMVGGLVIGLTTRISLVWLPERLAVAAAFLVLILVLLFRPQGIIGGVTTV